MRCSLEGPGFRRPWPDRWRRGPSGARGENSGIAVILGTIRADRITGTDADDRLYGDPYAGGASEWSTDAPDRDQPGNLGDLLADRSGNDRIDGRGGSDELYGDAWYGDDTLIGDGRAMLGNAKGGNDVLTGDAGADEFDFAGAFGRDMVTDFSSLGGEGDRLVFAGYTAADLDIDQRSAVAVITVGESHVRVLGTPVTPADILAV